MSTTNTRPHRGNVRRLALLGGPTTRPISGKRWFPLYGVLHHVGRRSGREFATPVVIRSSAGGTFVPLPFGDSTDWYRNARATGGLHATWKGRDHWLADPQVVARKDAVGAFNPVMRALMRVAGIDLVVRFEPIENDPGR